MKMLNLLIDACQIFKSTIRLQFGNAKRIKHFGRLSLVGLSDSTVDSDDIKICKDAIKNANNYSSELFHDAFCKYNGSKCAFSFRTGHDALACILRAFDLRNGDEVIIPAYNCIVVSNVIKFEGYVPVFADIELDTYGLSVCEFKKAITPKTKVVIVQHLYGLVSRDFLEIIEFAKTLGIYVIEDCAHSLGAKVNGVLVGNFGDAGFYSFEHSKVLSSGMGGVAVSNRMDISARMAENYRNAEFPPRNIVLCQLKTYLFYYYRNVHPLRHAIAGAIEYIYRKDLIFSTNEEDLQFRKSDLYYQKMPAEICAIALNQLNKIDRIQAARITCSRKWETESNKNGWKKPAIVEKSVPAFLRYPVLVDEGMKKHTHWASKKYGVEVGLWFMGSGHPINVTDTGAFPNAEIAIKCCINFPCLMRKVKGNKNG